MSEIKTFFETHIKDFLLICALLVIIWDQIKENFRGKKLLKRLVIVFLIAIFFVQNYSNNQDEKEKLKQYQKALLKADTTITKADTTIKKLTATFNAIKTVQININQQLDLQKNI